VSTFHLLLAAALSTCFFALGYGIYSTQAQHENLSPRWMIIGGTLVAVFLVPGIIGIIVFWFPLGVISMIPYVILGIVKDENPVDLAHRSLNRLYDLVFKGRQK